MSKLAITAGTLLALTSTAAAQVGDGHLAITYPGNGGSTIEYYDDAGVVQGAVSGTDSSWISSALMPDGSWVIHNNNGSVGLLFYSAAGVFQSFLPITVSFYSSDIDVFDDGVIAVCSRFEGLRLFDTAGPVGTIFPAGMNAPMGLTVEPDGTVWVADLLNYPGNPDGKVWHLDRAGNVLHSFDTPFDASDVDVAIDGTVWVVGRDSEVAHYQPDGTLIHQFYAQIDSALKSTWSLAVGDDGRVWVSGHYDTIVRSYNPDGTMASEFDTTATGNSTFTFITGGSGWANPYCFGDGAGPGCPCGNVGGPEEGCANSTGGGAILAAAGSNSATVDTLTFTGAGLVPNQSVLLFSANNAVNGGLGNLFGDGLRCAGGSLVRLGVKTANGSGTASWGPGLQVKGGWLPADTRFFQAWYRDPGFSPCGSEFNLSHGIEVTFLP